MKSIASDLIDIHQCFMIECADVESAYENYWLEHGFVGAPKKPLLPIYEKVKEDYSKAIRQVGEHASNQFKQKIRELVSNVKLIASKLKANLSASKKHEKKLSNKKVKIKVYDSLIDFYQSCMKEIRYITEGPTTKEKFDEFVAKFSKKKAEILAKERAHRKKCLLAGMAIIPAAKALSYGLDKATAALTEANAAVDEAYKNTGNIPPKAVTESGEDNNELSEEDIKKLNKMSCDLMVYLASNLSTVVDALNAEADAINKQLEEELASADKENL